MKILFLPVAHCELSPIELIWAFVKGKVSELNKTGGSKPVLNLTLDCLKLVTPNLWKGCIREAIKYENKFWERDRLIETNMTERPSNPNLVIDFSQQTDSSESESESDDGSSSSDMEN